MAWPLIPGQTGFSLPAVRKERSGSLTWIKVIHLGASGLLKEPAISVYSAGRTAEHPEALPLGGGKTSGWSTQGKKQGLEKRPFPLAVGLIFPGWFQAGEACLFHTRSSLPRLPSTPR